MAKNNKPVERKINYRNYVSDIHIREEESGENYAVTDGYICLFSDSNNPIPDSHNSIFPKGSFKKTIEDRWNKSKRIQFLVNHKMHELPIGKILELREDNTGVYFKGEINLRTTEGRNVYELIKQGAISGMSFGFKIMNDYHDDRGIQVITEVMLVEISPVTFPSQHLTSVEVQSVRSADEIDLDFRTELRQQLAEIEMAADKEQEQKEALEQRDEQEVETSEELEERGVVEDKYNHFNANDQLDNVFYALMRSLEEFIWCKEHTKEDLARNLEEGESIFDEAKAIFFEAYEYFVDVHNGQRSAYFTDENKRNFAKYLETKEVDGDTLLRTTPLTEKDLEALRSGKAYEVAASKCSELDKELGELVVKARKAHSIEYKNQVKEFGTAERSILATAEAYERQTSLREAPQTKTPKKVEKRNEAATEAEAEYFRSMAEKLEEINQKLSKQNNNEE